ncbi:pyridoxamine 5'-phosphate oxidase family protein [Yaniella flava]|uniref:Pyridoxamine 5'-phosphate oxidase family protein n=1 Tax=Yaniella flava TaxID=287930 RepID=A0ABN2UX85_9MICC
MSVEITDHMAKVLDEQLAFIATSSSDGAPNIGPKGSIGVLDDTALIYDETTGGQTLQNIQDGSPVTIAVVDRAWKNGYRFTGRAELLDAGDIFTTRVAARNDRGKAPQICSVLVHVDTVSTFRPV